MAETTNTEYIGDGVYVGVDTGMVKLMTGDHLQPLNVIYLEPEVLRTFEWYIATLREQKVL